MTSPVRSLFNDMVKYGKTIRDRSFTPAEVTRILRQFLGTDDVKLVTHRDSTVDHNQVIIGGAYDPNEDEANYSSITIYVTFNPEQKTMLIKDIGWRRICVDALECIGHEIVHQTQYRDREFDIGPIVFASTNPDDRQRMDQEYLGDPDEIEAYGYSIAAEVFLKHHPKVLTSNHIFRTMWFKAYARTFGARHPVVTQLLDFTVKYYTQLNIGESYVEEPEVKRVN